MISYKSHTLCHMFVTLFFQFRLNYRVRSYMNATPLHVPVSGTIRKTQWLMEDNPSGGLDGGLR